MRQYDSTVRAQERCRAAAELQEQTRIMQETFNTRQSELLEHHVTNRAQIERQQAEILVSS